MADELLRALGERQGQPPPDLDDDPRHRGSAQARAMLRVFEGPERAALLDDVLAHLDEATSPSAEPRERTRAEPTPPPVELAARRRHGLAWVGLVAALAAALVLWLGLRPAAPPDERLPPYVATRLGGGTATMRSEPADVPSSITLAPDATIDWILTPRSPVRTPVGVVILASSPGQASRLVQPPTLEVSEEGVVRITGPRAQLLPLPPGAWSIAILLGAPSTLPRTAEEAEASEGRAWSRVSFEVNISPAP